jgi:hypothetical protein
MSQHEETAPEKPADLAKHPKILLLNEGKAEKMGEPSLSLELAGA